MFVFVCKNSLSEKDNHLPLIPSDKSTAITLIIVDLREVGGNSHYEKIITGRMSC